MSWNRPEEVLHEVTERFGAEKITGGDELTSVATGLALRAAEEWPADRARGGGPDSAAPPAC